MAQRPNDTIMDDVTEHLTPEDWASYRLWFDAQFPISGKNIVLHQFPYHEGHIMDNIFRDDPVAYFKATGIPPTPQNYQRAMYHYLLSSKVPTMQRKAFVLLSGGLDSTTCLFKAIMDYMPPDPGMGLAYGDKQVWHDVLKFGVKGTIEIPWVEAFSVNYGQRHTKELEYAKNTCDRLGIKHTILDVGSLLSGKTVMLAAESVGTVDVPDISYADIKGVSPTYVPFRNGLMLSAITAQVQKYVNEQIREHAIAYSEDPGNAPTQNDMAVATSVAKDMCGIYFGAHSEDAQNWAYPDCTPEFIGSMANAIYIGTYMTIRLHTPLEWLLKSDIVTLGDKLGVPFEDTWSCYKGEEMHCGTCPTCRSRKEAFEIAGVIDPTPYANTIPAGDGLTSHVNPTTPNAEA